MGNKTVIVGSGVSGLVAAYELEERGFHPLIIDASDSHGGRVKTTIQDGFVMDHGFQVLLTAYPEAQHYLDYDALDLKYFDPGAFIFGQKKKYVLRDPRKNIAYGLPMLFSSVGTLADKIRVMRLALQLVQSSNEEIFNGPAVSTREELNNLGFSEKFISRFFKPFLGGIFLEGNLETSQRMFRFVMKMFAEGHAAIPAKGIQAISDQLFSKLNQTDFKFNTRVKSIEYNSIITDKGPVEYDKLIIATDPSHMFSGFSDKSVKFHEVYCLYFSTDSSAIGEPMLGLVPGQYLINNFHFPTDLNPGWAPDGRHLLSATVLNSAGLSEKELTQEVTKELKSIAGVHADHLRTFHIKKALPVIDDLRYTMQPTATKIQDRVFLAGDHLLNPSLNAAMVSGRIAALGALSS